MTKSKILPPRPKKQDVKPKVFPFSATQMIWHFETPTKRRLLWMIAHYPYIFNPYFLEDMIKGSKKAVDEDSKLSLALKVLHSLKMDGMIYQTNENLEWRLTLTGKLYRITSHPAFPLTASALAIIAIGIGLANLLKPNKTTIEPIILKKSELISDTILKPENYVDSNHLQTVVLKDSGSFLIYSGKTKIKAKSGK